MDAGGGAHPDWPFARRYVGPGGAGAVTGRKAAVHRPGGCPNGRVASKWSRPAESRRTGGAERLMELKIHAGGGASHDFAQLGARVDAVTVPHIDLADRAGHIRRGVLALDRLLIAALSPGLGRGRIRKIDAAEELVLLHNIALLKGITENLPRDQGSHRVGVCRLQGAAAGEGGGDVPPLHGRLLIGDIRGGRPPAQLFLPQRLQPPESPPAQ